MQLEEFLSLVLPTAGVHCLLKIKGVAPNADVRPHFYEAGTAWETLANDLRRWDAKGNLGELYVAMAGFEYGPEVEIQRRKGQYAVAFRSLWLDIDCGEGPRKQFPTKAAAATALEQFVIASKLPRPYVIQSGGGLHVYWPFDRDVTKEEWHALALRLKDMATQHGFPVDMSVTADAARVMRPIETTHRKDPSKPRPVKVVMAGEVSSIEALQGVISAAKPAAGFDLATRAGPVPEAFRSQMRVDNTELDPSQFSAKKIMAGCQQFRWAAEHQVDCSYDLWRLLITTLQRSDNPAMVHEVSNQHPDYDYDETEEKAQSWQHTGSVLCKTVEAKRPGGCAGCPLHGQGESPSSLGFIKPPEPPLPKIDEATGMPVGWEHDDRGYFVLVGKGDETVRIDLFPGSIELGEVFAQFNADGNVVKYVPVKARTKGGMREGVFSAAKVASDKDVHGELLRIGIAPHGPNEKVFLKGMRAWVQQHLNDRHQAKAVTQLGWTSTDVHRLDDSFVLGDTLYKPDGTFELVKLDHNCAKVGAFLTQQGSLDEWKAIQRLYNRPCYRRHKVVFWMTFAPPLARLMGIPFPIAHTFSPDTGVGKTGLQRAQVSFWGNPRHPWAMIHADATPMMIRTYETVMNGVICNVDEISRMSADAQEAMTYESTHLTGRLRLNSTGSMQEARPAIGLKHTTGNISLKEVTQTSRVESSPLTARVWEISLQRPGITFEEHESNRQTFARIEEHFGVAAPVFIGWLVQHQEQAQKMLRKVEDELRRRYESNDDERFWVSLETCMIVGAMIAKKLGLIDHDIDDGIRTITANHFAMRGTMKSSTLSSEGVLMRFVQENQAHQLTVDRHRPLAIGEKDPLVTTIRRPTSNNNVQMRYVTTEKQLFVAKDFMRRWFAERGLDFTGFTTRMQNDGVMTGETRVVLTAYTTLKVSARPVCLIFDLSKLGDELVLDDDGNYGDGIQSK